MCATVIESALVSRISNAMLLANGVRPQDGRTSEFSIAQCMAFELKHPILSDAQRNLIWRVASWGNDAIRVQPDIGPEPDMPLLAAASLLGAILPESVNLFDDYAVSVIQEAASSHSPASLVNLHEVEPQGRKRPRVNARSAVDSEEVVCSVRQMFSDGASRTRESAIAELARLVGFSRAGTRIAGELDSALRTAVRRGILDNSSDALRLSSRSIENFDREFLKEQFLASLGGRHWVEREDSIRGFARWLGFRRTGVAIEDVSRSLINGLLREVRLESDGFRIRRST
jgi:hypothetical protein